jgi:hypothetical protein
MVSNVFVCLAAAYFLLWLLSIAKFSPRTRVALASVLALFFMIEQVNTGKSHDLDRPEELDILQRVATPPANCSVFFITKPAISWRWPPGTQIDAMLTAERFHVPTVNGYSGVFPKSWDLMDLKGDYQSKALARALNGHPAQDVCGLDMETGGWKLVDGAPYALGTLLDFHTGGNAAPFEDAGWGGAEPGGTWTIGKASSLHLWLQRSTAHDLMLEAELHAFVPPQKPRYKMVVWANGFQIAEFVAGERDPIRIAARIDAATLTPGNRLDIEFRGLDDLLSPEEYGLNPDPRRLRLQLLTLRLAEAN